MAPRLRRADAAICSAVAGPRSTALWQGFQLDDGGKRWTYWLNHRDGEQPWRWCGGNEWFDWERWHRQCYIGDCCGQDSNPFQATGVTERWVDAASGNKALAGAFEEAAELFYECALDTHRLDLTNHQFQNHFDWHGWAASNLRCF